MAAATLPSIRPTNLPPAASDDSQSKDVDVTRMQIVVSPKGDKNWHKLAAQRLFDHVSSLVGVTYGYTQEIADLLALSCVGAGGGLFGSRTEASNPCTRFARIFILAISLSLYIYLYILLPMFFSFLRCFFRSLFSSILFSSSPLSLVYDSLF